MHLYHPLKCGWSTHHYTQICTLNTATHLLNKNNTHTCAYIDSCICIYIHTYTQIIILLICAIFSFCMVECKRAGIFSSFVSGSFVLFTLGNTHTRNMWKRTKENTYIRRRVCAFACLVLGVAVSAHFLLPFCRLHISKLIFLHLCCFVSCKFSMLLWLLLLLVNFHNYFSLCY